MKLKSIFIFATGVTVGSVVTTVKIGRAISKNDIAKQALADMIAQKIDDILFKDNRSHKPKRKPVTYTDYFNTQHNKEERS